MQTHFIEEKELPSDLKKILVDRKINPTIFLESKTHPKLSDDIAQHASWLFEHIYSVPYIKEHAEDKENDAIAREHHGIQHASRVAMYVPVIANLFRKYNDSLQDDKKCTDALDLTNDDIKLLQIAALLHDAARLNDGKDEWDQQSATLVYYYLTRHLKIASKKAKLIAEAVCNKDSKKGANYAKLKLDEDTNNIIGWEKGLANTHKNIYQKIVHDADSLDIARVHFFDGNYLDFYNDIAKFNPHAFLEMAHLIAEVRSVIDIQGDSINRHNLAIKRQYENKFAYTKTLASVTQRHQILKTYGELKTPTELQESKIEQPQEIKRGKPLDAATLHHEIKYGCVLARSMNSPSATRDKWRNVVILNETPKTQHNLYGYVFVRNPAALYHFDKTERAKKWDLKNIASYKKFLHQYDHTPSDKNKTLLMREYVTKLTGYQPKHHLTETINELEWRKAKRRLNIKTPTSKSNNMQKDGNPKRSATQLGWGTPTFSKYGYLIVNPPTKDIESVAEKNIGSGFGKKHELKMEPADEKTIQTQLATLKRNQQLGLSSEHNEITLKITEFHAIYYNQDPKDSDDKTHEHAPILHAYYLQREAERIDGTKLPIFRYSGLRDEVELCEFSLDDIKKMWIKICSDFIAQQLQIGATPSEIRAYPIKQIKMRAVHIFNLAQSRLIKEMNPIDFYFDEKDMIMVDAAIQAEIEKNIAILEKDMIQRVENDPKRTLSTIPSLLLDNPSLCKKLANRIIQRIQEADKESKTFNEKAAHKIKMKEMLLDEEDINETILSIFHNEYAKIYKLAKQFPAALEKEISHFKKMADKLIIDSINEIKIKKYGYIGHKDLKILFDFVVDFDLLDAHQSELNKLMELSKANPESYSNLIAYEQTLSALKPLVDKNNEVKLETKASATPSSTATIIELTPPIQSTSSGMASMLHELARTHSNFPELEKLVDVAEMKAFHSDTDISIREKEQLSLYLGTPHEKSIRVANRKAYFTLLLSDNGLKALQTKLITVSDALEMPTHYHLRALLSEQGMIGLEEKLITPAGVLKFIESCQPHASHTYTRALCSPAGIAILRQAKEFETLEECMRELELNARSGIPFNWDFFRMHATPSHMVYTASQKEKFKLNS